MTVAEPSLSAPSKRERRPLPPLPVLIPALALALLTALMVLSPPARDRGDQFLQVFRRERQGNLTIIDLPLPNVPGVDAAALEDAIALELPEGRQLEDPGEAGHAMDFTVRTPHRPVQPKVWVYVDQNATIRIDRPAIEREAQKALGLPVQLPRDYDAPILAQIAGGVRFQWTEPEGTLTLSIFRNPRFYTTQGPTWDELRTQLVRNSSFLFPSRTAQLQTVQDWDNTVLVPVPPGATTRRVRVDNTDDALLIERPGRTLLIWQRFGVVHLYDGYLSGNEMVQLADNFR